MEKILSTLFLSVVWAILQLTMLGSGGEYEAFLKFTFFLPIYIMIQFDHFLHPVVLLIMTVILSFIALMLIFKFLSLVIKKKTRSN